MEPKLPAPDLSPERAPIERSQSTESLPVSPNPEAYFDRGEQPKERQAETVSAAVHAVPVLPTPIGLPVPPAPHAVQNTAVADDTDTPLLASDEDLIEKEWVDKAKKIITETKDDPHRREQEVAKLQADYLKKRYGKELGAAD